MWPQLVVRDADGGLHWEDGPNRQLKVAGGVTQFSRHAIGAISCMTLLPNNTSDAPPPTMVFAVFPALPVAAGGPAPTAAATEAARQRSPEPWTQHAGEWLGCGLHGRSTAAVPRAAGLSPFASIPPRLCKHSKRSRCRPLPTQTLQQTQAFCQPTCSRCAASQLNVLG